MRSGIIQGLEYKALLSDKRVMQTTPIQARALKNRIISKQQVMHLTKVLFILLSLVVALSTYSTSAKAESPLDLAFFDKVSGNLSIDTDLGYDSNVSVDEIDLTTERGDQFAKFGVDTGLEYQHSAETKFTTGYKLSDKRFDEFNNLNSQTHILSSGASHKYREVRAELVYRFIDANLGGDDFLKISQWSPALSGFISKNHFLRLGYGHGRKWFADNRERNASNNEIGLDYYFFLNGIQQYVATGIKFKHENTEDPEFDYQQQQWRLRYQYRSSIIGIPVQYKLGWRYQRRDYGEKRNSSISEFRLDKRFQYKAALELKLIQELSGELSFELRDNQSNLSSVDYVERIVTVSLRYGF